MTIVCATDFSDLARGARRAAAAIAARSGEPLRIVHVHATLMPGLANPRKLEEEAGRLQEEVDAARAAGATAVGETLVGSPTSLLRGMVRSLPASLLVVGWAGHRPPTRWLVGSVTSHLAHDCACPLLVVREAASIVDWARRERPLTVALGDDLQPAGLAAAGWLGAFSRLGPTRVTSVHLAWPPRLHEQLGHRASQDLESLQGDVQLALSAEVRARTGIAELAGAEVIVQQGYGRPDHHLVLVATEMGADLLVVGAHSRQDGRGLWDASVSRGILGCATQNLVMVPERPTAAPVVQPKEAV